MPVYDTGALEPTATQSPAAPSLNERLTYARELSQSGLLPRAYQGHPANVLVAIETGNMLGIAPMAALHNIHIVEGKPTLSAALMSALVRRSGHRMRVWSDGDDKAIAELIRHDDPDFTYRAVWTTERAKGAKLLGKDVWQKYRTNMLKNRAASEVCRDGAQEVFLGPVYVPEELGAPVDAEGDPVVIEQQPEQQARQDAADRVDWEGDLKTLTGNHEGLRELYRLAKGHSQPQEYLDRVQAAGEAAAEARNAPTADPDSDAVMCGGTGAQAEDRGDMVMTTSTGRELGLCGDCQQWVTLQTGHYLPHAQNNDSTNEGEEA